MASINPTTVPSKRLAASINAASASFQLNNINGWDGVALTSADFGTKAYGVFRNPENTAMEIFEFDPATIASASITILRRGLKFTGDLTTEVTANKLTWIRNETIVELGTDVPQLFKNFVDALAAQTIAGAKTFSSVPATTGGNAVTDNELVRKAQLDLAVLGTLTNVKLIVPGNAGATVAAGDGVYLDSADSEWKLWDADTAATVENVLLGIAQGAGTDGNAITGGVLLYGKDPNQSGLTANTVYYASNTAGDFSSTPGTKEVTVGIAVSTTEIIFFPRYNQQLTENQQDLIAAIEAGTDFYAASVVGTDSYAITIAPPITAYATGMRFRFKADVANTGAATLAVSGLSAITIKKMHDQDLESNDIEAGTIVEVVYDGTNFQMVSMLSRQPSALDYQVFTTPGANTWTKPTGLSGTELVIIQMWGAGGAGGGCTGDTQGGGGGGGGCFVEVKVRASDLGATETVTIGAGGTGSTGSGTAGGNTSFGSNYIAYGGGGGATGATSTDAAGGGGGGSTSVGGSVTGTTGGTGGGPAGATAGASSGGFGGAGGGSSSTGGSAFISGAGGGGCSNGITGGTGGSSIFGGGGGGAGGTDVGGGGTAGTSKYGGNGGAGGIAASTNANGVAGSAPGGGGGGGGRKATTNATGGAGARGECRVWVIR